MKFFLKPRMKSFTTRSLEMIQNGRGEQGTTLLERGLKYYSDRILNAINPYAESDAWMTIVVLKHITKEIEEEFPEAKEFADDMEKYLIIPSMKTVRRPMKPNRE